MFVNCTSGEESEAARRKSEEVYADLQRRRRNLKPTIMSSSALSKQQQPSFYAATSAASYLPNHENSGWFAQACPWDPTSLQSRVSFDDFSLLCERKINRSSSETLRSTSMPPSSDRVDSAQSPTRRTCKPQTFRAAKAFSPPMPYDTPTMHPWQAPSVNPEQNPRTNATPMRNPTEDAKQKDVGGSHDRTPAPAIPPHAPPVFQSSMPDSTASCATAPLWHPNSRRSHPERNQPHVYGDRGQYYPVRVSGADVCSPRLFTQTVLAAPRAPGATTGGYPPRASMRQVHPASGSRAVDGTPHNMNYSLMTPALLPVAFPPTPPVPFVRSPTQQRHSVHSVDFPAARMSLTCPVPAPRVASPKVQRRISDCVALPAVSVPRTRAAGAMPLRTLAPGAVPPERGGAQTAGSGCAQRPTAVAARPTAGGTQPTATRAQPSSANQDTFSSSQSPRAERDSLRGLQRASYAEVGGRLPSFATIPAVDRGSLMQSHVLGDLSPDGMSSVRHSEIQCVSRDSANSTDTMFCPAISASCSKRPPSRASADVAADVPDADTIQALSPDHDDGSDALATHVSSASEKPNDGHASVTTTQAATRGTTACDPPVVAPPASEMPTVVDGDGRVSPAFGFFSPADSSLTLEKERAQDHKRDSTDVSHRVLVEPHRDRRSFFDRVDVVKKGLESADPHAGPPRMWSPTASVRTESPLRVVPQTERHNMCVNDGLHPAKSPHGGACGSASMAKLEFAENSQQWKTVAARPNKDVLAVTAEDDVRGAREDGTDAWTLTKRVQWIIDIINRDAIERVTRYSMLRAAMCAESERVNGFQDALEQLKLDAAETVKTLRREKNETKTAIKELRMNMFSSFSENQIESRRAFQSLASGTANVVTHATVALGTRESDFDAARTAIQREMRKEMLLESSERQGLSIAGNALGFAIERECMCRTKADANVQHKINGLIDALESFKIEMADMEKKVAIQMQFEEGADAELLKDIRAHVARVQTILGP